MHQMNDGICAVIYQPPVFEYNLFQVKALFADCYLSVCCILYLDNDINELLIRFMAFFNPRWFPKRPVVERLLLTVHHSSDTNDQRHYTCQSSLTCTTVSPVEHDPLHNCTVIGLWLITQISDLSDNEMLSHIWCVLRKYIFIQLACSNFFYMVPHII